MSDNTSQTGTDTIATDDIGGVKYQRVKVNYGPDGSSTDVSASNPLPVTQQGNITVSSTPAASRNTDSICSTLASDALMVGLTSLQPVFQKVTVSSSGATTIVAAVTGYKIRVVQWSLSANGTVNVKWQSHVTPTDLTGLYYAVANSYVGESFSPIGHFETVSGEALDINLSAAVAVGGVLAYIQIPG